MVFAVHRYIRIFTFRQALGGRKRYATHAKRIEGFDVDDREIEEFMNCITIIVGNFTGTCTQDVSINSTRIWGGPESLHN